MNAKQKPAIVLLHGWGLSASRLTPLEGELKKRGYDVLVPDFPGFGTSVMPDRPFRLSDYVAFLDTYIKKITKKPVVLVGHSFGGRVALRYCRQKPPQVAALILTGTPGFTPVPRKKMMLFVAVAKLGKYITSVWPLSLVQKQIRLWYYWLVGAREFFRAEGVMRETFKLVVQEDLEPSMRAIDIPCLLVWGERDVITPVWIAKKMKSVIDGSDLVIIPEAGHGVPFQEPKQFVSSAVPFLSAL